MPLNKTKTLALIILFADALFIGTFIALFNFTKGQITESVNKENSIKTELKMEDIRVLMKDDLILGKEYKSQLSNYILPKDSTIDFIKTIEDLSLSSGVKSDIKTVTNDRYDKGEAIGAEFITIKMDVLGAWDNVQLFLKYLESYPLRIDIKMMSLNKVSDRVVNGRNIPQWAGNFEFTVVKIKDTK